jgi:hypothetical protein
VRLTDEHDVDAIIQHLKDKEKAEDPRKRNAVYLRDFSLIEKQVSAGFFVALERVAANEHERKKLKADRAIVAATGAYPLGLDSTGNQVRIPIQSRNGEQSPLLMTYEIGSSLYVKPNDLPNENGLLPKGCTYDLIVGMTTLNLFRLAARYQVEAITANVQTELDDVIARLTGEYLCWNFLPKPSPELTRGSLITTVDKSGSGEDNNFKNIEKFFFRVTPDKLPTTGNFLYTAYCDGGVTYNRGSIENRLNVDFSRLPNDLVNLMQITATMPGIFRPDPYADAEMKRIYAERPFSDVRRAAEVYMPREIPSGFEDAATAVAEPMLSRRAAMGGGAALFAGGTRQRHMRSSAPS